MREQGRRRVEAPLAFRREPRVAAGVRPLVSVLLVNFNGGALLCESVRSVLASNIPVEVLLSDNGSTDGSLQLVYHLFGRDPRVHVIENGAPDARYAIVERVHGAWQAALLAVPYDHESMARLAEQRGQPDWAHALRTGYMPRPA